MKPGNQEGRKMALEHEALTGRIIGAAIEVHRRLGPGFLESVYEQPVINELKKRQRLNPSESLPCEGVPAFLPSSLGTHAARFGTTRLGELRPADVRSLETAQRVMT